MLGGHLIVCICRECEETGLLSDQNNNCNFESSSSCVPLAYAAKWLLYLSLGILNFKRNAGLKIGCSAVIWLNAPFKIFYLKITHSSPTLSCNFPRVCSFLVQGVISITLKKYCKAKVGYRRQASYLLYCRDSMHRLSLLLLQDSLVVSLKS